MQPCILAKNITHINGIHSFTSGSLSNDMIICGLLSSIPLDYTVRCGGKSNMHKSTIYSLPIPKKITKRLGDEIIIRTFLLNSIGGCLPPDDINVQQESEGFWSPLLGQPLLGLFAKALSMQTLILSDLDRMLLQMEIDVLSARSFGLKIENLIAIYREGFHVLMANDAETFYDYDGKIIFTVNRGLPGVGLPRKGNKKLAQIGWTEAQQMESVTVDQYDEGLETNLEEGFRQVSYSAPFETCDRVKSYVKAWEFFEREGIN